MKKYLLVLLVLLLTLAATAKVSDYYRNVYTVTEEGRKHYKTDESFWGFIDLVEENAGAEYAKVYSRLGVNDNFVDVP